MNTETTGQQAEVTADAAVDAVETVIWRYEHGEEIFSGMLKDANEGVAALRERLGPDPSLDAELAGRRPDLTRLLLRAAADRAPLGRDLTAAVCRAGCGLLGERHPGASIEVQ